MLSPQDRVTFPHPSYIFGANRYISDTFEMIRNLEDGSGNGFHEEAVDQARKLATRAIAVSEILLSQIEKSNSA